MDLKHLTENLSKDKPELAQWVAEAVAKTMVEEGYTSRGGLKILLQLINCFPKISSRLYLPADNLNPTEIEPFSLPNDENLDVFKYILNICAGVQEIKPGKLLVLERIGKALCIKSDKISEMLSWEYLRVTEIQLQVGDLFDFLDTQMVPLNRAQKKWIAEAIGGAINADGTHHRDEMHHLDAMAESLNDPGAQLHLHKVIKAGKIDREIFSIKLPKLVISAVLKAVVRICIADRDLHEDEISYINRLGRAMNINGEQIDQLLKKTVVDVKKRFFNRISKQIVNPDQRKWLAAIIIKLLFSGNQEKVTTRRWLYLNDVMALLGENRSEISPMKMHAKRLSFEELSEKYAHFGVNIKQEQEALSGKTDAEVGTEKTAGRQAYFWPFKDQSCFLAEEVINDVLKYLVDVAVSDNDFNLEKTAIVHKAALLLKWEESRIVNLMMSRVNDIALNFDKYFDDQPIVDRSDFLKKKQKTKPEQEIPPKASIPQDQPGQAEDTDDERQPPIPTSRPELDTRIDPLEKYRDKEAFRLDFSSLNRNLKKQEAKYIRSKFCTNCGEANHFGADFCKKCGSQFVDYLST